MAVSNDKAVESLNYLIGTLHDGEKGYRDAADEVDSSEFQTIFNRIAQERASFRADLEGEVRRHGGEPKEGGSASAALHRTWLNVRDAITGKSDEEVLKRGRARRRNRHRKLQRRLTARPARRPRADGSAAARQDSTDTARGPHAQKGLRVSERKSTPCSACFF